jgi:hypothetical protein
MLLDRLCGELNINLGKWVNVPETPLSLIRYLATMFRGLWLVYAI